MWLHREGPSEIPALVSLGRLYSNQPHQTPGLQLEDGRSPTLVLQVDDEADNATMIYVMEASKRAEVESLSIGAN